MTDLEEKEENNRRFQHMDYKQVFGRRNISTGFIE